MADIEAVNGVAAGSIEAINGVAKSSIEAANGMTVPGGIPASITEGEYLAHWYKMDEGSTSAVTDAGLNASSTNMTLVGASSETGGPSAIGTPSVIKFNGTTGVGSVPVRSGGTNTVLGTLFNTSTWTVTWWMKDSTSPVYPSGARHHFLAVVGMSGGPGHHTDHESTHWPWEHGWGVQIYYGNFAPWQNTVNTYGFAGGWSGASSWRHHALGFEWGAVQGEWAHYINSVWAGGGNNVIDTGVGTHDDDVWFSAGAVKHSGTVGVGSHTAAQMSDIRFYNIALTTGNIDDIYAGDWT